MSLWSTLRVALHRERHIAKSSTYRSNLRSNISLTGLDLLEERAIPSAGGIDLGAAAQFGVLGLYHTEIENQHGVIDGHVGVSRRGSVWNAARSSIAGNVNEFRDNQYFGRGHLGGQLLTNADLMNQADADALAASRAAFELAPTATLRHIRNATSISSTREVNVIDVRGNISASLTLNGSENDVFIINVRGGMHLHNGESITLTGGLTADHVLLNFVGRGGEIHLHHGGVINGTILAPRYEVNLHGATVNGEVIAGGGEIRLGCGAKVNQGHNVFGTVDHGSPDPSIEGYAFVDYNGNLYMDPPANGLGGDNGYGGIVVTLTGTNDLGESVTLETSTDGDGHYFFDFANFGLRPGTYRLTFTLPWEGGTAVAGTGDGIDDGIAIDSATIDSIVLSSGEQGINYNLAVPPQLS